MGDEDDKEKEEEDEKEKEEEEEKKKKEEKDEDEDEKEKEDEDEKKEKETTKKKVVKKVVKFPGDFDKLVGKSKAEKAAFLKACSKSYADKDIDVKCGDVKAGSVVLTLIGKSTKVMGGVVKECVNKGLSFGDYELPKGQDVTEEEEEKEEEKEKEEK